MLARKNFTILFVAIAWLIMSNATALELSTFSPPSHQKPEKILLNYSFLNPNQYIDSRAVNRKLVPTNKLTSVIVVFKEGKNMRSKVMSGSSFSSFSTLQQLKPVLSNPISLQSTNTKSQSKTAKTIKNLNNMFSAKLAPGVSLNNALIELNKSSLVEYAEPDYIIKLCAVPNDPLFNDQWELHNTGQEYHTSAITTEQGTAGKDINWISAYENSDFSTNKIIIAVSDTGIDYNHLDISSKVWKNVDEIPDNGIDDDSNGYIDDYYGYNFYSDLKSPMDDHGHGTHVAGIIGAATDNGIGIAGTCPSAVVMAIKIFNSSGQTSESKAIEGILYAVANGAKVINCSWGFYAYSKGMDDVFKYAIEEGVTIVAAAGNAGSESVHYPSGFNDVLNVTANNSDGEMAAFGNYGSKVDCVAPGDDILSLSISGSGTYQNDYISMDGTSMSAPYAAGLAGLLINKNPGFDAWIYPKVIEKSCNPEIYNLSSDVYAGKIGGGIIDVQKTLNFNSATVFMEAHLTFDNANLHSYVIPEDILWLNLKVGTWKQTAENVKIKVFCDTSGIRVNGKKSITHKIGDISGYTTLELPNDLFEIKIQKKAELGGEEILRVEVEADGEILDSYELKIYIFKADLEKIVAVDLEGDGKKEYAAAAPFSASVFNSDGSIKWFYEVTDLSGAVTGNDIAAADLDGDGKEEVILTIKGAYGSSSVIVALDENGEAIWRKNISGEGDFFKGPVIADINQSGNLDVIICNDFPNDILVYEDGNLVWKISGKSGSTYSLPAVGDVDNDGENEIVFTSYTTVKDPSNPYITLYDQSQSYIHIYDKTGKQKNKFEIKGIEIGGNKFADQPVLADLDLDGRKEIIVVGYCFYSKSFQAQSHAIAVYNIDGKQLDGWPKAYEGYGAPVDNVISIADIDLNGNPDVFVFSTLTGSTYGWNYDGSALKNFPIVTPTLFPNVPIIFSDNNNDNKADLTCLRDVNIGKDINISSYDSAGLMLHGFPITFDDADTCQDLLSSYLSIENGVTNQVIAATIEKRMKINVTTKNYSPTADEWPCRAHDSQRTSCYKPLAGIFGAGFYAPNTYAISSLNASFIPNVVGNNTSGLSYYWDFTNDGIIDSNEISPSYNYSSPGVYSVKLIVSNSLNQAKVILRENYIHVLAPLDVDFSANITYVAAPAEVSFADLSLNSPDFWSWDFGDGSTSTEQNPSHIYSTPGKFSVSLTISNHFGDGGSSVDAITKTDYINIYDIVDSVDTHYVAENGKHISPFKNWEEAATNVNEAVEISKAGDTVLVNNGVYFHKKAIYIPDHSITLKSVNGPLVTIIDGNYIYPGIASSSSNTIIEGFTVRRCIGNFGSGIRIGHPLDSTSHNIDGSVVRNCIVSDNASIAAPFPGSYGGGICMTMNGKIENSIISSNYSNRGGGVYTFSDLSNCVMYANEGVNGGGAIWASKANIYNSLFYENYGMLGIIECASGGLVANCTITKNTCGQGALFFYYQGGEVRNSIVYDNEGPDMNEDTIELSSYMNNCVEDFNLNNYGEISLNNITNNPMFLDLQNNNFRLKQGSPSIDSGTNYVQVIYSSNAINTVSFDFGLSDKTTPGNWNNITDFDSTGVKIQNAIDSDGNATAISLYFDDVFDSVEQNNISITTDFPDSAIDDYFCAINYGSVRVWKTVRITGLDSDAFYSLEIVSGGPNNTSTDFKINGSSAVHVRFDNPITFQKIQPNENDEIIIEFVSASVGTKTYGSFAALKVNKMGSDSYINIVEAQADLDGNPRIFNNIVDMGCYEYDGNFPPVARLAISNQVGPPTLNVSFFADDSFDYNNGSITNYSWSFGDGSFASGQSLKNVNHSYSETWQYVVKLTVTDNGGKSDSIEKVVTVKNDIPKAPKNFRGNVVAFDQIELFWDDVQHENGYVISRGEQDGYPVDIIVDQEDANVKCYIDFVEVNKDSRMLAATNGNDSAYGPATNMKLWYQNSYVSGKYRHNGGALNEQVRVSYFPDIPIADDYEILEWHPKHTPGVRGEISAALNGQDVVSKKTIHYLHNVGDEKKQFFVNQRDNCGQWNSLGIHKIEPGSYIEINCVNLENSIALFDAIRFVRQTDYIPIATAVQDSTNILDEALNCFSSYTYYIKATNEYGSSPWTKTTVFLPSTNATPKAEIISVSNTSGEPNLKVYANGLGSGSDGNIINYEWNFGDEYEGSRQEGSLLTNVSYTYQYPGLYNLSLQVYDSKGLKSTNSAAVMIEVIPEPTKILWIIGLLQFWIGVKRKIL